MTVVIALIILYFASGSPVSLYSLWRDELGVTNSDLSLASMCYFFGTVIPLLFLPRISDHLGRRPATVMILLVSLCGVATFAMVSSPAMIMVGRFIQGFASGLGSSTVAAYVVDLSVGLPRWVGPMITSSAPTVGLALGAFASGGTVSFSDVTPETYFWVLAAVIVVIAVLVLLARETMPRSPGLARSLIPQFSLPEGCLRIYLASAVVFVGTWSIGGFSQSFSAVIVSEQLGYEDTFISAVVFAILLLPNILGSYMAKRYDTRHAQRLWMGMFSLAIILMYVSLAFFDSLLLFCLFSILAGVGQGVAFTAGVSELTGRATKAQRAGTFSLIYLTSYGGAAIPNLVVGMFSGDHTVEGILLAYAIYIFVMFLILLALTAKPYPKRESSELLTERRA